MAAKTVLHSRYVSTQTGLCEVLQKAFYKETESFKKWAAKGY